MCLPVTDRWSIKHTIYEFFSILCMFYSLFFHTMCHVFFCSNWLVFLFLVYCFATFVNVTLITYVSQCLAFYCLSVNASYRHFFVTLPCSFFDYFNTNLILRFYICTVVFYIHWFYCWHIFLLMYTQLFFNDMIAFSLSLLLVFSLSGVTFDEICCLWNVDVLVLLFCILYNWFI